VRLRKAVHISVHEITRYIEIARGNARDRCATYGFSHKRSNRFDEWLRRTPLACRGAHERRSPEARYWPQIARTRSVEGSTGAEPIGLTRKGW
jgi:hypothetical protein